MADYESVDSRNCIRETGANLDRESVVSIPFRSESERSRSKRCAFVKRQRKSAQKSLNGKLNWQ